MAVPEVVGDQFVILPIQLPPTPSYPHSPIHEIRVRRNAPKEPTANDSRSLYLKNVPVDSTEPHFRAVFTSLVGAGRFETVKFENDEESALAADPAQAIKMNGFAKKRKREDIEEEERREEEAAKFPDAWSRRLHKSSSTAVVLLADEKSVQQALKAITKLQKSKKYPIWGSNLASKVSPLGSSWITSHLQNSRLDQSAAQASVHAFFNVFNRKEREAIELAKRLRNEPDEDGFVTVTRGGRSTPASRAEADRAKKEMDEKHEKKKNETRDFYRFQLRERRKIQQAALMRRFESDKRKVDAMKEKRGKFKPET